MYKGSTLVKQPLSATRSLTTVVPRIVADAGTDACRRFIEFFTATIRNANTREAYARAVRDFLGWCEVRGLMHLDQIEPIVVATYVEELHAARSAPTVKLHLAAIRMLFDWLVTGQVLRVNPASSVRGPRHVVKKGKSPVLTAGQCRELLDSIDKSRIVGLRDRAIVGVMVYSFARVSAVMNMNVGDFYNTGVRWMIRLHEKGGKFHEVPAHHNAVEYVHEYVDASGIAEEKKAPLFRTMDKQRRLTRKRMTRDDALRMVKRRATANGLPEDICCHTFRATGITAYLDAGGTIENAQAIAAHESPRTTKLYDRTGDEITLDEVERILI
jgi:integrase/recombinase XerD